MYPAEPRGWAFAAESQGAEKLTPGAQTQDTGGRRSVERVARSRRATPRLSMGKDRRRGGKDRLGVVIHGRPGSSSSSRGRRRHRWLPAGRSSPAPALSCTLPPTHVVRTPRALRSRTCAKSAYCAANEYAQVVQSRRRRRIRTTVGTRRKLKEETSLAYIRQDSSSSDFLFLTFCFFPSLTIHFFILSFREKQKCIFVC